MRATTSASSLKQPPSPNPSDLSDVSEGQVSRYAGSDCAYRGTSKTSVTSGGGSTTSTPAVSDVFRSNGPAFAAVDDQTSPETYEEQTRTWPRKRGSRSNRRRQSEDAAKQRQLEPVSAAVSPLTIDCPASASLNDRLDLAELSPSKYGCKRESTADYCDSPYAAINSCDLQYGSCYGSDPNVLPASTVGPGGKSRSRGGSSSSSGGHYSAGGAASNVNHLQQMQQHRHHQQQQHNVSIVPVQWQQSSSPQPDGFSRDHAEHILLSQGRRQQSSSSPMTSRYGNESPSVNRRTLYEPHRHGVAGGVTCDPFVAPGYGSGAVSRSSAPYQYSPSPTAAVYSPNLAAGRTGTPSAGPAHSRERECAAVDALFDNLYKTNDGHSFESGTPYYSTGRPTPVPAHQWPDAGVRPQQTSSNRRSVNCPLKRFRSVGRGARNAIILSRDSNCRYVYR
jgi:hypothetical protein